MMDSTVNLGLTQTKPRRAVCITGASSGIGLQLAKDYLSQGWFVIACGRSQERLNALTQQSQLTPAQKVSVACLVFDIAEREQVQQAAKQLSELLTLQHYQLELVILNAGTCEYIDDAQHFDDVLFERVIHTNLIAMGYCIGAMLPLMPRGARLGLMSSSAMFVPFPRAEAYGASKAGVHYLSASLALDLAQHGIGVSVICPGFVATPLTDKNDFSMPMQVSVAQASKAILAGLSSGKREIHFPRRFTYLLKLLSFLPAPLWQKLMAPKPGCDSSKDVNL